jgi:chromatin remodeling complex protein RSC6
LKRKTARLKVDRQYEAAREVDKQAERDVTVKIEALEEQLNGLEEQKHVLFLMLKRVLSAENLKKAKADKEAEDLRRAEEEEAEKAEADKAAAQKAEEEKAEADKAAAEAEAIKQANADAASKENALPPPPPMGGMQPMGMDYSMLAAASIAQFQQNPAFAAGLVSSGFPTMPGLSLPAGGVPRPHSRFQPPSPMLAAYQAAANPFAGGNFLTQAAMQQYMQNSAAQQQHQQHQQQQNAMAAMANFSAAMTAGQQVQQQAHHHAQQGSWQPPTTGV